MEKRGTQDRTVQTEMKHHWTEDAGKPYVPLTLLTILYHIDCTEKPAIGEENLPSLLESDTYAYVEKSRILKIQELLLRLLKDALRI